MARSSRGHTCPAAAGRKAPFAPRGHDRTAHGCAGFPIQPPPNQRLPEHGGLARVHGGSVLMRAHTRTTCSYFQKGGGDTTTQKPPEPGASPPTLGRTPTTKHRPGCWLVTKPPTATPPLTRPARPRSPTAKGRSPAAHSEVRQPSVMALTITHRTTKWRCPQCAHPLWLPAWPAVEAGLG